MARSLSPLLRLLAILAGTLAAAGANATAGATGANATGATATGAYAAGVGADRSSLPGSLATSNLARLESAAAAAADSILDQVGGDSLCVAVVAHDAGWLIEAALVERAAARGLTVRRCEASDAGRIDVAITAIGVMYRRIGDGLERIASLSLSASAPASLAASGSDRALRTLRVATTLADTLDPPDTSGLADAAYGYTIGIVADDGSGGFWRTIVEPAVVLAASAIVAILLFTVRSQ